MLIVAPGGGMGIRHTFDADRGIVRAFWEGPITAEEVARYWTLRIGEVQAHDQRRALVDLSRCEVRFAGDEMLNLIRSLVKPNFRDRQYRVAILTRDLVQYGTARQFQALFNDIGECAIFEEEAVALEWLDEGMLR